ncbi:uncharacterized protein LY89DRAFT_732063 [Mollisia scopiformis]|uniref:Uncharacterized protein n=1 Tax=Mollisia scopiformis TaxID=149040 RepID=A0A194XED3_MOLSC|nr:uncharacterized protein LY89DRAFT_732063 [Mollisia scopiformis]KUJ18504.1 hypothetical protein LY89DRAFT_732063 [Mollisia scopiformis]
MSSYHRILAVFDRSVQAKSLECDYDIHPWEILINEERWPGKIRLVGFVDVFFLICYSSDARFEQGIIIYKDDEAIRSTLHNAGVDSKDINLDIVNKVERQKDNKILERYFEFKSGTIDYTITSLGHDIGLKAEYPKSSLKKYVIKLRKSSNTMMKKRIRRGVNQHSLLDLMQDSIRLGVVTHAEMTAKLMSEFFVGTATDDAMKKYLETFASMNRPDTVALSNDRA